jgi:hypothetical protein
VGASAVVTGADTACEGAADADKAGATRTSSVIEGVGAAEALRAAADCDGKSLRARIKNATNATTKAVAATIATSDLRPSQPRSSDADSSFPPRVFRSNADGNARLSRTRCITHREGGLPPIAPSAREHLRHAPSPHGLSNV